MDGLLRDKTRPSCIPKLDPSIGAGVVALTMEAPPSEATRWTGAAMAEAAGLSVSSVQRIWRAHGLQPHRVRQFKLSKDPTRRHKRAVLVARRMGENGESGRSAGPRGTPVSQTIARSLNPTPFRGVHIPHT